MDPHPSRRFHLIIDAHSCNPAHLTDREFIKNLFPEITKMLGMSLSYGPVLVEGIPVNPGITAFAIIDFSHISIHTFTLSNEFCLDIFSCKQFDFEKLKKYILTQFGIDEKCIRQAVVKYDELAIR